MEKEGVTKLTVSQENILRMLLDFVNHPTDRVFILKGYAGTGKTTLMRFLINHLNEMGKSYKLLASTGRAAKVLSNLSGKGTTTIHSLIYSFNGLNEEPDDKWSPKVASDGQLFLTFSPVSVDEDEPSETIYIIDEASMVSDVATMDVTQAKFGEGRVLSDLLNYDERPKSKFVFVGDPCQLPPIEEYYSPALLKDYFRRTFDLTAQEAQLTEIMRQKGSNDIINASKAIRNLYNKAPADKSIYGSQRLWGYLPFRNLKDIQLHHSVDDMMDDYVRNIKRNGLNHSICICKSNKVCHQLSNTVRHALGLTQRGVEKGVLLMVIQNNMPTGLMNGDMVVVEEILPMTETRAHLTFRQVKVKELFTGNTYNTLIIEEVLNLERLNLDRLQQQGLFVDFIMRMKEKGIDAKHNKDVFYDRMYHDPYLNALRCTLGYAVTCHKSQGGEWQHAYVHMPRNITLNPTKEAYQWIYTAMTRAKTKLHLVDDFYIR